MLLNRKEIQVKILLLLPGGGDDKAITVAVAAIGFLFVLMKEEEEETQANLIEGEVGAILKKGEKKNTLFVFVFRLIFLFLTKGRGSGDIDTTVDSFDNVVTDDNDGITDDKVTIRKKKKIGMLTIEIKARFIGSLLPFLNHPVNY